MKKIRHNRFKQRGDVQTAQKKGLNPLAFGYAGAITFAFCMLAVGFLAPMGLYQGAATMMGQYHMFFSLSILGVILGMIEAAILGFIFAYLFAWVYNKFA